MPSQSAVADSVEGVDEVSGMVLGARLTDDAAARVVSAPEVDGVLVQAAKNSTTMRSPTAVRRPSFLPETTRDCASAKTCQARQLLDEGSLLSFRSAFSPLHCCPEEPPLSHPTLAAQHPTLMLRTLLSPPKPHRLRTLHSHCRLRAVQTLHPPATSEAWSVTAAAMSSRNSRKPRLAP